MGITVTFAVLQASNTTMRAATLLTVLFFYCLPALGGDIALVIDHRIQGETARAGETYRMDNGSWFFKPRFLKYYLAELTLIHDGGKRTPLTDVYVLVDALSQERYPLGSFNVERIEAIEFHVGVDKLRNHLDPTIYPPEHPLALKNPTMHWGWAAGYRFLAVEGSAGTSSTVVSADVQVHTVGNQLYRKITMPVSTEQTASGINIQLTAEYSNLFTDLDVSFGLIFHGLGEETVLMSDNMATSVFSSPTTSVNAAPAARQLVAFPNPTSGVLRVQTNGESLSHVTFIDALGSAFSLPASHETVNSWDLSQLVPGMYTLVGTTTSGSVHHVPIVVHR